MVSMPEKFEALRFKRLMSAERHRELPPEKILRAIGLGPGQTFVDIGAGPGFFTLPAARIVGAKGRVHGLDISPLMVAELKKNAARAGLINIRAARISETGIPLPAGADVYLMVNVFHELDDRSGSLRQIRNAMIARSRFILIDFLRKKTPHGPPLRERISLRAIRPILEAAGLAIERVFRPNDEEYGVVVRRDENRSGLKTEYPRSRDKPSRRK
jgi:ubiquinone/menaquinone biosynthesis C-methylase UbiE